MAWSDLPLESKMFENVDEFALTKAFAAQENCIATEAGTVSRFPGLVEVVSLGGNAPVYLEEFHNDMVAVDANGRFWRVSKDYSAVAVEGTPITGGRRVTFGKTEDILLMAAGAEIIEYNGADTRIHSAEAPKASHVVVFNGYGIANEIGTGRWWYSDPGNTRSWPGLNVFNTTGEYDDATAIIKTPFGELLVAGPKSIEQYAPLASGSPPFVRRWTIGENVKEPYTMFFADNAVFCINQENEVTRLTGQSSQPQSGDVNRKLEAIDDFKDAWGAPISVDGQRYLVFQFPYASTPYGTKGITYLFDFRQLKWCHLYGWDTDLQTPTKWPGWSVLKLWDKTFVGGNGKIYELRPGEYQNNGLTQRMLIRTAHFTESGESRIEDLRLTILRGLGGNTTEQRIMVRCNRDNRGWGRWVIKGLGKSGKTLPSLTFGSFGIGNSFQFEIACTDNCKVELKRVEANITKL